MRGNSHAPFQGGGDAVMRRCYPTVDGVTATTGASKAAAGKTIDAAIATITGEVTEGGTVQLVGFGSFSTSERAARVGRNPATNAEIQIAAAKTVKSTAGKAFKEETFIPFV